MGRTVEVCMGRHGGMGRGGGGREGDGEENVKRRLSGGEEHAYLEHPVDVSSRVSCLAAVDDEDERKRKELLPCTVIERKEVDVNLAGEKTLVKWSYYVHLDNSDRRLDKWVDGEALFPLSLARVERESNNENGDVRKTRHKKRLIEQLNPTSQTEIGSSVIAELEKAREEKTKVKNIEKLVLGDYEISTWYFSPYPHEYAKLSTLYTCAYCLKYMRLHNTYATHVCKCQWSGPPGLQIYIDRNPATEGKAKRRPIKVNEVDGMLNPLYCQNLCLLAKLFLDHKTLCYDVPPFLFYVLTEQNEKGYWELVGFFSKEKEACGSEYNVACILVLPHHQRKGYGKFLISLSYDLTRREGKVGTPERPLSDLGQVSYRGYWTREVLRDLKRRRNLTGVTAMEIAHATGFCERDICMVLKSLGMLRIWKGEHMLYSTMKAVEDATKQLKAETSLFKSNKLKWSRNPGATPFTEGEAANHPSKSNHAKLASKASHRPAVNSSSPVQTTVGSKRKLNMDDAGVSTPATHIASPERTIVDGSGENDKAKKVAPHRFTQGEVEAMKEFVSMHGLAKIRAPMNSAEGLQRSVYEEFANRLSIDFSRCKEKIKRMAGDMVVRENATAVHQANASLEAKAAGTDDGRDSKAAGEGESDGADAGDALKSEAKPDDTGNNDADGAVGEADAVEGEEEYKGYLPGL